MFAVPGWSVSAPLVKDNAGKAKGPKTKSSNRTDHTVESKKRKRSENHEPLTAGLSEKSGPRKDRKTENTHAGARFAQGQKRTKADRESHARGRNEPRLGGSFQPEEKHGKNGRGQGRPQSLGERQRKPAQQLEGSTATGLPDMMLIPPQPVTLQSTTKLSPLQLKMRSKLTSARFRHLNQTLYTTDSAAALQLFNTSPELFAEYHAGFSQQVKDSWPQNPVDEYISAIKSRGKLGDKDGLPRRKTGSCTIADLGCGDAPLARGCQSVTKVLKLKFHSFDLHAANEFVTKADISNLPLRDGEADVAVFCLSLMGTNWINFVEEAWRILRGDGKGEVWVAEVKSRFGRATKGRVVENSVGKKRKTQKPKRDDEDDAFDGPVFAEDARIADQPADETDISAFQKVFQRRGFMLREESVHKNNKMFVSMVFVKSGIPTAGKHKGLKWNGKEYQKQQEGKPKFGSGQGGDEEASKEEATVLKPCVYKTR